MILATFHHVLVFRWKGSVYRGLFVAAVKHLNLEKESMSDNQADVPHWFMISRVIIFFSGWSYKSYHNKRFWLKNKAKKIEIWESLTWRLNYLLFLNITLFLLSRKSVWALSFQSKLKGLRLWFLRVRVIDYRTSSKPPLLESFTSL